jgi:hypothetical protein
MSTRNIPGGKRVGAWGWRPHHLHVPNFMKISESKPPGTLWATPGLLRDCFNLYTAHLNWSSRITISNCQNNRACSAESDCEDFCSAGGREVTPFWYSEQKNVPNTVGYATTKDTTSNECYNEQFLSIKSECYNEHRCYNERVGILSADVARVCAWSVGPSRYDQSVSHHLCYRLQGSVISLVQLSAYLYSG